MAPADSEPAARKANLPFRLLRFLGRGLFGLLFRLEVAGLGRTPASGGYVLACNHLSWIDPLLLLACLPAEPRIHFLAAAEYTVAGPWPARQIVRLAGDHPRRRFRKRIRLRVGPLLAPGPEESQGDLLERVAVVMAQTVPPLHPDQPRRKYLAWLSHLF